jgi:poly [ADP-ribose] polymerase 2/3/4
MATLIKEIKLIMTEVGTNNNKWWTGQLFDDGTVKANWGRVGYSGDSGEWGGGDDYLQKKIREKLKKGYTELKTVGNVVANPGSGNVVKDRDLLQIAKTQLVKSSNPVLEKLIKRFVDANVHKITSNTQITYNSTTGLFATPLGIVTMEGLTDARNLLSRIAPWVRTNQFGSTADTLLSQYLRLIPQSLGMGRFSCQSVIPNDNALQKQNDLIDALESSYQAIQSAPVPAGQPSKPQERVFKVDLDVLADQQERSRLENYFERSKKRMHGYDNVRVKEIFAVTIHDMANAYSKNLLGNIEETYHGTSQANCLSILKCGLKISPPSTAAIAGALFGPGIYGAKSSTKSLGYTFGRWGQGGVGDSGWLFVCDFKMGTIYSTTDYGCSRPRGYDSIWARASTNGLKNDELIVGQNSQCNIKYLLECK